MRKNKNFSIGNISNCHNVVVGNGNIINGTVINSFAGDGVVINNGVITANGCVVSSDGQSYQTVSRLFECTAEEKADTLVFSSNSNCFYLNVTADESIERITAEVKASCSATKKKKAEKILDSFSVQAKTRKSGIGRIASFEEINPCSDKTGFGVSTAYDIRIPKSVNDILIILQTGNVIVKGFEGTLSLTVNTGKASVSNCILDRSKITVTTGDIKFIDNTVNKDVAVCAVTGKIELSVKGGNGDVSAEVTTGRIDLLNENFDIFRVTRETITGKQVFAKANGCSVTANVCVGAIK